MSKLAYSGRLWRRDYKSRKHREHGYEQRDALGLFQIHLVATGE